MLTKNEKEMLADELDLLLNKAVMSDPLRTAVSEAKNAIVNNNICLAEELTSVKRLVTSEMDLDGNAYPFREDSDHNLATFDDSAYGIWTGCTSIWLTR